MTTPSQPLDDHSKAVPVLAPESTAFYPMVTTGPTSAVPYLFEQIVRVHTDTDCWICLTGAFNTGTAMPMTAGSVEYFYIPLGGGVSAQAISADGTLTVTVMV